ncbi:hypothetical protein L21SP3_00853 [Sedimentisphaera cyanobacteriorum]|uniref:Uncharacterized protein n=1 Tax=Sedimentisphaera cyanobacteriorum TaxID=1940790 RepID=A0A1Q2HP97_9BACT|nr:hypothetical protein [Sedimentisphaera cyanobacteriorum]AQQ09055.1 hypothetical protein L21SP3_00853 [Sedimentisphaera cyanobacteriorum]
MRYAGKILFCIAFTASAFAVNSKLYKFDTAMDFTAGETENTAIDSEGTLHLNKKHKLLADKLEDVWAVNDIVVIEGEVFAGTSPNAGLFRITDKKAESVYRSENKDAKPVGPVKEENGEKEDKADKSKSEEKEQVVNEHIFAVEKGFEGKLTAGISGEECRILEFEKDLSNPDTLCKIEDAAFIFDLKFHNNSLYAATGPNGKIFKISPEGETEVFFDSIDRGITVMAFHKGKLYAGTDKRGLLYCIDMESKKGRALFDSPEMDITSINFDDEDNIYITAAIEDPSAESSNGADMPGYMPPHPKESKDEKDEKLFTLQNGGLRLKLAATAKKDMLERKENGGDQKEKVKSALYKIAPDGIVSVLGKGSGVFLDSIMHKGRLWVADGKDASLSQIDTDKIVIENVYRDKVSSEITSLYTSGGKIYAATANPPRIIEFYKGLSSEGWWQSDTIDAKQPSKWGSVKLEAKIPEGCEIQFSSRGTNVQNAREEDFTEWTKPLSAQSEKPAIEGSHRFLQLKLMLKGMENRSPKVNAAAVASVVRNIKPVVAAPMIKSEEKKTEAVIAIPAKDENDDELVFSIDIQGEDSKRWVNIEKDHKEKKFKWDTSTVPDGIYKLRVTASDRLSNGPENALESVSTETEYIVDNTPPVCTGQKAAVEGKKAEINFELTDKYTVIGKVSYTLNSSDDWNTVIPDDLLADSKKESFTINLSGLEKGDNILAVKYADEAGNSAYERFVLEAE